MKTIESGSAPRAIGPYSHAQVSGNLVFASGQLALDRESGELVEGGIAAQTEKAILNLEAVLEAAGSSPARVIKTTCFLQDMDDFAAFNEVYAQHFPGKPARSCVAVRALPRGALVEIEAVAER